MNKKRRQENMVSEELRFIDDKLVVYKHLPQCGEGICVPQLVMTKEIFQECYRRWIEPQEKSQEVAQCEAWSGQDLSVKGL